MNLKTVIALKQDEENGLRCWHVVSRHEQVSDAEGLITASKNIALSQYSEKEQINLIGHNKIKI